VAGVGNTAMTVWSTATGTEDFTVAGHSNQIYAVTFSADGADGCVRKVSGADRTFRQA
jgi:hypothetical protein